MKKISNQKLIKLLTKSSKVHLGHHTSYMYSNNPKQLLFTLSRYKFVAKMFEGFEKVLEIGAGDGFQSSIVKQYVKNLTLSDIDKRNKEDYMSNLSINNNLSYILFDPCKTKSKIKYDGIFALDVLEHINPKVEKIFLRNIKNSLKKHGSLIIGTPSLESQKYASYTSKAAHVNCKSKFNLRTALKKHFSNVYMFSMNDEVAHTGFDKMSHYNLALCN
jgi:2-polyprenyl-3-methyl-5-hydroxy-6-metoxy-1,4-benzoquinol methylase